MNAMDLDSEKLLRQVITSVAQLPPNDLLVVYETINDLKQKESEKTKLTAAEIVARARSRAAEMSHLSHEEVVQRFIDAMERIRADAIAKGMAIEGEWERD
jgi:glucokinase